MCIGEYDYFLIIVFLEQKAQLLIKKTGLEFDGF